MEPAVAVYAADEGGCGHYRCIWPARALAAQGAAVQLVRAAAGEPDLQGMFEDLQDHVTGEVVARRLVDVVAPDADVVVFQRPLRWEVADAVPILQAKGIRVVVEIDDDFAAIHPRNVSFPVVCPRTSPERSHLHLMRACAAADHVVVTTPALARRYARHGRFTIVPNHVPASYLAHRRPDGDFDFGDHVLPGAGVYVGWTGSVDTHPTDLQVTRGAVARAVDDADAIFTVVGTGKGVRAALELTEEPPACGWVDLADYPARMACLDVGIVPLDDIRFNQAKSALKVLEFGALGVAAVASPTEDNVRAAKLGVGVLAAKPREWRRHVHQLAAEPELRADVAGRARVAMADRTIEQNAHRWWDAWTAPLRARSAA